LPFASDAHLPLAAPISDVRFPMSDFRCPISDVRFPMSDFRFPISH
jgi:hypothetical protein